MSGTLQNNFKVVCRLISVPQSTLILFPPKMQFSDEKLRILKGNMYRYY